MKTLYEKDLVEPDVLSDWLVLAGRWSLTPDGLSAAPGDDESVIMLRLPVLRGSLEIEITAVAGANASRLGLYLGLDDGDSSHAACFEFGIGPDAANVIRIPGHPDVTGDSTASTPDKRHTITVRREAGRFELAIAGSAVLSRIEPAAGLPGPYMALFARGAATFSHVQIRHRPFTPDETPLNAAGAKREQTFPTALFRLSGMAAEHTLLRRQLAHLRRLGLDARQQVPGARGVVIRHDDWSPGGATVTRGADGLLLAAWTLQSRTGDDTNTASFCTSPDNGTNWSSPTRVAESAAPIEAAGIVTAPSGVLVVSWTSGDGSAARAEGNPPAWCARSSDNGMTWDAPTPLPLHAPHGPIATEDGRLLCVGRGHDNGTPVMAAAESRDDGRTWTTIWTKSLDAGERRGLRRPHVVQLPGGSILAAFHGDPIDWDKDGWLYLFDQIWLIGSDDGGRTWTTPWMTPMCGAAPHLSVLADGALLCSYTFRRRGLAEPAPMQTAQAACVSHNDGRTWNIDGEILVRADAPDHRLGYPSSVPLPNGRILTLYTQTELSDDTPALLWSSWALPAVPKRPSAPTMALELGTPVTLAVGPERERRWGFYQFTHFRHDRAGNPVAFFNIADDGVGGLHHESPALVSEDGGQTWTDIGAEAKAAMLSSLTLRDGTELAFMDHFLAKYDGVGTKIKELGVAPALRASLGGFTMDFFRCGDLPAEEQALTVYRRRAGSDEVETFRAPLDFPDLAAFTFITGYNSDKGGYYEFEEPELRLGFFFLDCGFALELPDGTLLSATDIGYRFDAEGRLHRGVYVIASEDGGNSWAYRGTVAECDPATRREADGEPGITRLANGRLVCVVRGDTGGNREAPRELVVTTSTDDGRTWEPVRRLNDFGVWPRLLTLENGVTACVYGRSGVEVRFSCDTEARQWSEPVVLHPSMVKEECSHDTTCGYCGVFATGPNRFLVLYSDFYHRADDWSVHKAIKVRSVEARPG